MTPASPSALANESESEWVEGELIRELMRTAHAPQYLALAVVPIMTAVLLESVVPWKLALWTLAALAVAAYRLWFMNLYMREFAQSDATVQREFMRRYGLWWPASAAVWGLSCILHFDKTPLTDQFICWLIIAGLGTFSTSSFAAHRPTQRSYINWLGATVLGVIAWRAVVDLRLSGPVYHYWLFLLVGLNWLGLLKTGDRLHQTARRNAELRYRNAHLIDSLTRQTDAALAAVKVKDRFLASAAHDLRQPVHALALYADWLRTEPELASEIAPKIVSATRAVNALFDSLFDLARLDAGQVEVRRERIDLVRLLQDLDLQYRPIAQDAGLSFRLRAVPATVLSDQVLLKRVLGNLIANAIRYTPSGGVLVASRRTPRGVRIEVWDTGVGIPLEHQKTVFEEFYKVPSHPGTEDGFGLGLSIVARLLALLGHSLKLSSRPGRGSVFRLEFQEAEATQVEGAALRA
jgi:signal transduction histidine kinase